MPEDPIHQKVPDFLANGGAVGALIGAQDWHGTALGALDTWPSTLKSMLATLLTSPQPMTMTWGPQLLSFFNDSYRLALGERFRGIVGRPAAEQWPDAWPDLEPLVCQALGGVGSHYENMPLSLTRNGQKELTWWTLSFMPFRSGTGEVAGVYCFPTETTEKVLADQRKAEERKRQAFRTEFADALREAANSRALMAIAAQKLGVHLNASCVGYANVDESEQWGEITQNWVAGEGPALKGGQRLDNFGPLVIARLRSGRIVAVNDTANDPILAGANHQSMGSQAFIDVPLVKNNRLALLLFVLNAEPRAWTGSEIALVEEVAERTWACLQRLQAELALQEMSIAFDQRTSDLVHLENVLRQSQKLDVLGQLTSSVAHDFNNLLAIISACIELLRGDDVPAEQRLTYANRIFITVERAAKLTNQLLAFSRQEPFAPEVIDVGQQVQTVVDLVRPLMGTQVEIHLECSEKERCCTLADMSQFETALINLAVNARDAMNAQGKLTIKVQPLAHVPAGPNHALREGDFVAISVTDAGCGIPLDKIKTVFEPFYTTKAVGKGTGLGLSQVFDFVQKSGGEIEVMSELGHGTVFTVYLPRVGS
jgi:signal transduction histidine kinase